LSAHGFAAHAPSHSLSAHALHNHGLTGRALASSGIHGVSHNTHAVTSNTNTGRNAFAHNAQLSGHNALQNQFAHNNALSQGQLTHNQLTHNQFAAQNFHGLNNFNRTGFNRNAFGNNGQWNHWGGHFWGAGWNNWGWGWGGWAGPVFWPFVLGDVLSFVFWPDAYYDPFWAYGPPFVFASIFAPGPYFGPDYGYGPDYYGYGYRPDYSGYGYGRSFSGYGGSPNIYYNYAGGQNIATTDQADRQALAEVNNEAVQSCAALAPGVTNLPVEQIRQKIHPTADQEAALEDLSAAMSRANETIQSSCPTTVPLTPIARLDAAEQRLDATIHAMDVIRAPLERFYNSLSDEQKQQLNAMNGSKDSSTASARGAENQVALCQQQSGSLISLPIQRIEQVVQPMSQQQRAFDELKATTQQAAEELQSSCPTAVPQSPVARLATAETRLKAVAHAVVSVGPALENFYSALNDEQKARFNMMGPPPRAASSQPAGQNGSQLNSR
jgi:hypothetical protein